MAAYEAYVQHGICCASNCRREGFKESGGPAVGSAAVLKRLPQRKSLTEASGGMKASRGEGSATESRHVDTIVAKAAAAEE